MQSEKVHLAKKQEGLSNMRNIVKAPIFRLIQIAWSPIGLVGYVLLVITMILFSRTSGVSSTTLASLYTRRMQHELGTRLDEPCERLMMVLPNVSHLALRLVTGGTLLAHRLTGYVPGIYRFPFEGEPQMAQEPAARTTFFDAALTRHLSDIDQLVILGAGWDTRSYRMPKAIHCFEVDTPKTQQTKRLMLKKAGLDTTGITFVPADFMTEDWLEKLVHAGFDPDKPTFFLWEGVTMYLDREAVESTLRKIAGTASGSVVAFDYLSPPPASKHVAAFLESCGLSMEEQRNFGQETDRKPAMAGFTTAIV
ncbi:MAG: class I SAM-dependent methyltransferase [Chloroflexi bacterium]|nr:MAG: class I SAM-dependent methyltransferase [Chloroflexota bacterium]